MLEFSIVIMIKRTRYYLPIFGYFYRSCYRTLVFTSEKKKNKVQDD